MKLRCQTHLSNGETERMNHTCYHMHVCQKVTKWTQLPLQHMSEIVSQPQISERAGHHLSNGMEESEM